MRITHSHDHSSTCNVTANIYCPVTPLPLLPHSLHPPHIPPLPPYIIHLSTPALSTHTDSCLTAHDLIHRHSSLASHYIRQLCDFGAVYLRIGPDAPPPNTNRPLRLTTASSIQPLPTSTPLYIRVHASPKRHSLLTPLSVITITSNVIVICKPAGLPVAPLLDNLHECVLAVTANQLKLNAPLHITTRLDISTSGVLILARHRHVVPRLNIALQQARKIYLAWTLNKPQLGLHKHWINANASRRRGLLTLPLIKPYTSASVHCDHNHDHECKWVVAELNVIHIKQIAKIWQAKIELITGRTHQIRIQFAALGCPLIGDHKYAAAQRLLHPADSDVTLGDDPQCLGLHALSLDVDIDGKGKKQYVASLSMRGTDGVDGLELSSEPDT